jgi:phosphate transport system substrate-binding protein
MDMANASSKIFTAILLFGLFWVLAGCSTTQQASAPSNSSNKGAYIQNKGSDTIVNLALAWAEKYQDEHSDISLAVTGGGSGTGITALISGTVDIANASRAMSKQERSDAEAKGIQPQEHIIARDAIAVIVNPENPVKELTLQQISAIYRGDIRNWKEVGGDDRPIVRLSRETNSGTHVYFLEAVIRLGDSKDKSLFSMDTLLLPSSEGIIAEVSDNPNAIGYDGLGYIVPQVKVLAIAKKAGQSYVLPSAATVNDNSYPISRDLYMYTRQNPGQAVEDYLAWIVSPEAQTIVSQLGFVPVVKK